MPEAEANGVRLYYELHGGGDPMVLVHGSWADATDWQMVVGDLAESFRVLVYDRRGHSRSERPTTQGSADEDGDDLAALLEVLDLGPAHVVTNSYGGNIGLRLATRRPNVFRSLSCHEPPLVGLLEGDAESQEVLQQATRSVQAVATRIAEGEDEGAARQFVDEVALGPGTWEKALPPEAKATLVRNAPTFLDEVNDPEGNNIDRAALAGLKVPVHLTNGSESPPMFARVLDRLVPLIPRVVHETIPGSAHLPQLTTPERYVEVITRAVQRAAA